MRVYITGTSAISPQATFEESTYLPEIVKLDGAYLSAKEPEYRQYIDPKLSRRMARIIKMSLATAKESLIKAKVEQPDAIIVGTGLGCLQDTEKFLAEVIENNEGLLSPTSFIQSTHNTIAGQIALVLQCPHHNFTYVQRGHTFENALEDAILLLNEGNEHILVGGVDEVTPTSFNILQKLHCTGENNGKFPRLKPTDELPPLGEGASFFLLSDKPTPETYACLEGMHTFYLPESVEDVKEEIASFLYIHNIAMEDLDAVMMGYNGYQKDDAVYQELQEKMFRDKLILSFKNLCGEYFTASAFGHHLAANILHRQQIFPSVTVAGTPPTKLRNILFYNHFQGKYHTLTLFTACQSM